MLFFLTLGSPTEKLGDDTAHQLVNRFCHSRVLLAGIQGWGGKSMNCNTLQLHVIVASYP